MGWSDAYLLIQYGVYKQHFRNISVTPKGYDYYMILPLGAFHDTPIISEL